MNCFSPVWFSFCFVKLEDWLNAFSQNIHFNGFSFVWLHLCVLLKSLLGLLPNLKSNNKGSIRNRVFSIEFTNTCNKVVIEWWTWGRLLEGRLPLSSSIPWTGHLIHQLWRSTKCILTEHTLEWFLNSMTSSMSC